MVRVARHRSFRGGGRGNSGLRCRGHSTAGSALLTVGSRAPGGPEVLGT